MAWWPTIHLWGQNSTFFPDLAPLHPSCHLKAPDVTYQLAGSQCRQLSPSCGKPAARRQPRVAPGTSCCQQELKRLPPVHSTCPDQGFSSPQSRPPLAAHTPYTLRVFLKQSYVSHTALYITPSTSGCPLQLATQRA